MWTIWTKPGPKVEACSWPRCNRLHFVRLHSCTDLHLHISTLPGAHRCPTPHSNTSRGQENSLIRSVNPQHSRTSGLRIKLLHLSWRLACCFGAFVCDCRYPSAFVFSKCLFNVFVFGQEAKQYWQRANRPCAIQFTLKSLWDSSHDVKSDYTACVWKANPWKCVFPCCSSLTNTNSPLSCTAYMNIFAVWTDDCADLPQGMYIKSTYDGLHVITGTTEGVSVNLFEFPYVDVCLTAYSCLMFRAVVWFADEEQQLMVTFLCLSISPSLTAVRKSMLGMKSFRSIIRQW